MAGKTINTMTTHQKQINWTGKQRAFSLVDSLPADIISNAYRSYKTWSNDLVNVFLSVHTEEPEASVFSNLIQNLAISATYLHTISGNRLPKAVPAAVDLHQFSSAVNRNFCFNNSCRLASSSPFYLNSFPWLMFLLIYIYIYICVCVCVCVYASA